MAAVARQSVADRTTSGDADGARGEPVWDVSPDVSPRAVLSRALSVPLVMGLTFLLPGYVIVQPGDGLRDQAYWLQLLLTCYAGARLSAMVLTRQRKLLQGTFWLFVYMAMGIAPLAQAVLGRTPAPVAGSRSDLASAVALVLLGCVVFDAGALAVRLRAAAARPRARRPALIARRRVPLLVALAFAGSGLFIVKLGGPQVFFTSRMEIIQAVDDSGVAATGSQAGSAVLRGFGTVPALLALLVFTRWLVSSRSARRRPTVWVTWFALLLLNGVVNNPVSNPRYWFLTVLLALLFTVFPHSPAMYRTALSMGVVAAVLVFPFADRFRYDENNYRPVESTSVLEPLALKDYDQTAMFSNTITYVGSGHGHTYGRQLAGSVFFYVPRRIWTGKPLDTGVMTAQWVGTTNTNLSSPLWAELWIDFGPLGMAAGFAALGFAAARTDQRYAHRCRPAGSGAPYGPPGSVMALTVPLVAGYSFILLRGPLLQASGRVAIAVLCLALVTTFRPERWRHLR
jgi:hypothetical protein